MPHTVKRGETLGGIAKAHGITLQRLLDLNPHFKAHPDLVHVGDVLTLPRDVPVAAPLPTPSPFARKLASVAQEQLEKFRSVDEADPRLCGEIKRWTEAIGGAFVSCTSNNHPWSAVFVSWCVKESAATASEFKFSKAHAAFVRKAIRNAINGTGMFHGVEITAHRPNVGDIIHHNRGGDRFTLEHASTHSQYRSHSVIVTEIKEDADGPFAMCIGGNEGNAVRDSAVRLTPEGFIRQRGRNPFLSLVRTLK